jgi:hypothetical protein
MLSGREEEQRGRSACGRTAARSKSTARVFSVL